ncbi:hypothetical protein BKP37_18495 [Anaerobacillus alkalilacustris]|uniref:PilZ domain-containing protein n=1 Tax=Anaerobacillus alkalilacustris TaxID=393763 RepID=A0A1S2LDX7_9BACI|nr:PilZ domain-containing protein [Anaerobacillus alkalilacustris]OIJ10524.1 hypothetical protein BKP37_18495 [Anaerobacillus alkalilacustris]
MKYKRDETFRYKFIEEISFNFKMISIDGIPIDSKSCEGVLLDISPNGCKILSPLEFPAHKNIVFYIEFTFNEEPIKVSSELVWKKRVGNNFQYGLKLHSTEDSSRLIVQEIKKYVKKQELS